MLHCIGLIGNSAIGKSAKMQLKHLCHMPDTHGKKGGLDGKAVLEITGIYTDAVRDGCPSWKDARSACICHILRHT